MFFIVLDLRLISLGLRGTLFFLLLNRQNYDTCLTHRPNESSLPAATVRGYEPDNYAEVASVWKLSFIIRRIVMDKILKAGADEFSWQAPPSCLANLQTAMPLVRNTPKMSNFYIAFIPRCLRICYAVSCQIYKFFYSKSNALIVKYACFCCSKACW